MRASTEVNSMDKTIKLAIALAFSFSASFALACDYPASPRDLPDGASATKEEMLVGVKVVAEYQENMSTYLACIEADEVVAVQALADDNDEGKQQRKSMFDKKYNAAVDEQTRTVERFNAEIRAYKSR